MYTYRQSSGIFEKNGVTLFTGYAGHGPGVNNPALQGQHNIGPLPQGHYTMTALRANDPRTGLATIVLTPNPANNMFGRSEFRIHGDNSDRNQTASLGCIVIGYAPDREAIWHGPDHDLEVVA